MILDFETKTEILNLPKTNSISDVGILLKQKLNKDIPYRYYLIGGKRFLEFDETKLTASEIQKIKDEVLK